MNVNRSPMDISAVRPLTDSERELVERGIREFSERFNVVPNVVSHDFAGTPDDLSTLDWVFYELGGSLWYQDHGLGFTCIWGNVLVRSFGFTWNTIGEPQDFRDYLLVHPDRCYLFPWQRLWETVENPSPQFKKAETAWLRFVTQVDRFGSLPDGWHPAEDAMRGIRSDLPEKVVKVLARLYEHAPFSFFEELGLWPYDWNAATNWDQVKSWLDSLIGQHS